MPPSPVPTGPSRTPAFTIPHGHTSIPQLSLLVLTAVTVIRLVVLYSTRRKRRTEPAFHPVQEKDSSLKHVPLPEQDPRQHGATQDMSQQQQQQQPQPQQSAPPFEPVYPWISPPQALPGPYDARLYPLPTIRRHSYDPSIVSPEDNSTTTSYTRRVSTNSLPARQQTLQGSITTLPNGWRRNQWIVSEG